MVSTGNTNLPHIPGYSIIEQLYTGSKNAVYRAQPDNSHHRVVIKVLQREYPNFSELVQFRNQYTIAKNLDIPGIVRPLSLEPWRNSFALVMEDSGGISLQQYIQDRDLDWLEVLIIALQLTEILHHLIEHRVVHKDIKPANILIHPSTGIVQIIDFSISSLLPKEIQELKNPHILEGTLAYLAPEQTGRMNRGIDYRTDFYSLGVTLYELLTGQLPFVCEDPLELVHCHIAKQPIPPHQINQNIPQIVSKIVLKLMAKNAEDRYQSALGLKYDLEKCVNQGKETGTVVEFELGKRDVSDRFIIPEKLYGREVEVAQLLAAFERIANQENNSELILVAGFSGIGKTAVVNEVHKPIVKQKGYFIKGKFDQFNRNIPFSALVQALRDLMGQLLSESDRQLQEWKEKIIDAVGENGQVIIEVIPELEKIIGKQPSVPELSGSAAQNRFNLLFNKFIQVFTTKEHPLVLFLDDLQWADSASLNLMKLLMSESEKGYLLLIGAYRDNEVFPAHPLMLTLDEIAKAEGKINTITLSPLSQENINYLVADTLSCSFQVADPLTELVYQKTKGNPFFTTQFMLGLYGEELIKFNFDLGHWECELAQVRQRALTDDVVEFMAQRLQKLPTETQDVLKLAACVGNQFDLSTLAIVCEESKEDTADSLWRALQEGLILPQNETYKFYLGEKLSSNQGQITKVVNYKFLHDRVQQAAYYLIPDEQKQATHLKIGQLLLQSVFPEDREERIFELVNQLNYGIYLITEQKEQDELAELNLIACRKARSATAYQAGYKYAEIGLLLLGENAWQRQYEMSLSFHELIAELASLCGDLEEMEKFIEIILKKAKSLVEKINIYRIRIQSNIAQNKLFEAIDTAQLVLGQLGVLIPQSPTQNDIDQEIAEINLLIGNRKVEDLVNLPQMKEVEQISIVQIANSIMSAAYVSGSPLHPLLVTLSVKLSIKYGNTTASPFAYASLGFFFCHFRQDIYTGVKFGNLALQVVSKLDTKANKSEVLFIVAFLILHRQHHIKKMLPLLKEAYSNALEVGNLEFVGHSAHQFCSNAFWCVHSLPNLEQETRTYYYGLTHLNLSAAANWCRIYWQSILNLLGFGDNPSILSGEALQETEFLPPLIKANDLFGLYVFYLYKLVLCYLFGNIESAQKYTIEVRHYSVGAPGTICEPVFHFYDSLTLLASLNLLPEEKAKILQQVEQNQTKLQQYWANHAPMNHQHKVDLVEAEKCRVLAQKIEAIELYDKAIAGAKANEYIQEEALANELAAKFYLNWGKEKVAAGYMQEAYYCYARWGAKAKTDDLEKCYPNLLQPILYQAAQTFNPLETLVTLSQSNLSIHNSTLTSHSSSNTINNTLDFAAVLKASQALSGIIKLDELLRQLTQIILQNSGGDRCALILPNSKGEWYVRAIATLKSTQLCSQPLENNPNLPTKFIQYVKNTQEVLVIDDLNTDLPVIDEYLLVRQPKSLLCLPILNQGHLIGILYLKNLSTSGAFTKERVLILNFLCTQAAISLENARLYQQSQDYAQQLEESQLKMVQHEKMASLGNLVAGVAHEINNPLGFLNGSIGNAKDYLQDIIEHLELYQEYHPDAAEPVQENVAQDLSYSELEAKPQKITIKTALITEQNAVEILIEDNGKGMTKQVKERIFDHLFTTKGVGKGTGLGLAIARQIIIEKHGGSLDVESDLGQGTTFCLRLPFVC